MFHFMFFKNTIQEGASFKGGTLFKEIRYLSKKINEQIEKDS